MSATQHQEGSAVVVNAIAKHFLPLIIPVLVGIGSAAITSTITTARLEERVSNIERKLSDHAQETVSLRSRDTEYERRISRTEAMAEETQRRLVEIGADVKILIKAEKIKP